MTTPPSLGDMTQVPVTTRPTQALPGLGGGVVTLYNSDLTNLAYVSYQQWFTPGAPNSVPIQPLANATLDATKPIYVAGLVAEQGPLFVAPGGTQLQPSPAQIAAQIGALGLATASNQVAGTAAINNPAYGPATLAQQVTQQTAIPNNIANTGVPLLALSTLLLNTGAATVGAGATVNSAVINHNQIGYHINLTLQEATAGTSQAVVSIQVNWIDSVTGAIVYVDQWHILPAVPGQNHVITGTGPTKGNQFQVSITNHDTVPVNYNLKVATNSRVYGKDDWRTQTYSAFTGLTNTNADVNSQVIADTNASAAANGTITRVLPLYAGNITMHARSANTELAYILNLDPGVNYGQIADVDTVAGKSTVIQASMPQAQCLLIITNTGSSTANVAATITGIDVI